MDIESVKQLAKLLVGLPKYYSASNIMEQDVGKFLTPKKGLYPLNFYNNMSNDLRHQYASARFTQTDGKNIARRLGDLNEFVDFNQSGRIDTEQDQKANAIGRQYGLKYPNYTKEQLLNTLYNDYQKNR